MLRLWVPILPEHIWSKVSRQGAGNAYQNKPPIVGSGPFQVVEWQEGQVRPPRRPTPLLGRRAQDRRALLQRLHQRRHHGRRTSRSAPSTPPIDMPAGAVQASCRRAAASRPTPHRHRTTSTSWPSTATTGPSSRATRCSDPKFRQALNWAVDKQKIVDIAYGGYATAGYVDHRAGLLDPYWHWEPPAGEAFSFDPTKATQLLDAAGYKDAQRRRRPREQAGQAHQAAPVGAHRVDARARHAGKLITGWFRDVGIKIKLPGRWTTARSPTTIYNYEGQDLHARLRHVHLGLGRVRRPGLHARATSPRPRSTTGTTACWTDPEYDQLYKQQATRSTRASASHRSSSRCSRSSTRQSPYIVTRLPPAARGLQHGQVEGLDPDAGPTGNTSPAVRQRRVRQLPHHRADKAATAASSGGSGCGSPSASSWSS